MAAMKEVEVETSYERARGYAQTLLWSLGFLVVAISWVFFHLPAVE